MTTLVPVARFHLNEWINYVAVAWGILAFSFVVNVIIMALVPYSGPGSHSTGGLAAIYVYFFVLGLLSIVRALPFGLALGVTRGRYYAGTLFLAVSLAAGYSLVLTLLQIIERASGGWGVRMHFFRVSWLLDGPWYLTWLTSFVLLSLLFIYGMWFGIVYRRWGWFGLIGFIAAQVIVLLAGAILTTWTQAWTSIGHFFTTLSAAGLTGLLALLAVALVAGGFSTMRRVTV